MKTQSMLKMLLVAALVISPAVVMAAPAAPAAPAATEATKTESSTPSTPETVSIYTRVKNAASTAASTAGTVVMAPYDWVMESKANAVAAAIIAGFVAKDAYAYMTASAKTKKANA